MDPHRKRAYALKSGGVAGGTGIDAFVSFPGIHMDEWNFLVAMARMMECLNPDKAFFSTACVFLPPGDPLEGKHNMMPEESTATNPMDPMEGVPSSKCWCWKLYKEPKPWGCAWFVEWLNLLMRALRSGQQPVVVFKKGQTGEGDKNLWDDFPIDFSTGRRGLGGSQAGEVAMLKKLLNSDLFAAKDYKKVDAERAATDMSNALLMHMDGLIRGEDGAQKIATVIRENEEIQGGLMHLSLFGARIRPNGARTLASELGKMTVLRRLDLGSNALGTEGLEELAPSMRKLVHLEALLLSCNEFDEVGCAKIASVLWCMPRLKALDLGFNNLGTVGMKILTPPMCKLVKLEKLDMLRNNIGEGGAVSFARALNRMPLVEHLDLRANQVGPVGIKALSGPIGKQHRLTNLSLHSNDIGTEGAFYIAAALKNLTLLVELYLSFNAMRTDGCMAMKQACPCMKSLVKWDLRNNGVDQDRADVREALYEAMARPEDEIEILVS